MGFISFVLSLCLLAIGLCILYFLGSILYQQIRTTLSISNSTGKINRLSSQVKKVDAFIAIGEFARALSVLENAFVVEPSSSKQLLVAIREHHQNILSRCLIIAEEQHKRVENIAEIERLLSSHIEIQYALLKANESLQGFTKRHCCSGKQAPSWSTKEFEQKIDTLNKGFLDNKLNLKSALKSLFAKLKSQDKDANIVYH